MAGVIGITITIGVEEKIDDAWIEMMQIPVFVELIHAKLQAIVQKLGGKVTDFTQLRNAAKMENVVITKQRRLCKHYEIKHY